MALIEVARFADITEAQVAAAALRASGIDAIVPDEHYSYAESHMLMAIGGVRVWAPEADAAAAQAFIADCRSQPSEASIRGGAVRSVLGLGLGLLFGPVLGYLATRRRSRV